MIRTYRENPSWTIGDPQSVRRRVLFCGAALIFIFALLLSRLWYLQVVEGKKYLAIAQSNRTREVPISSPRGLILDRKGRILATSRATHSIAVVPAALPTRRRDLAGRNRVLDTLAFLIGSSRTQIEKQIDDAAQSGGRPFDPVRLQIQADLQTITRIEENRARLGPSVLVTSDLARVYPNGALAAHVLGYSGLVTREELDKSRLQTEQRDTSSTRLREVALDNSSNRSSQKLDAQRELSYDDIVGKIGIEKQYDALLAGAPGAQRFEVDARGRPIRQRGTRVETPGKTLSLTIDARLQKAAESALDKASNSGAAVAIDPRNGEVLVLASRPTFNPNVWSLAKKQFQAQYLTYNKNPKHPLINRAVSSRFPPGSTFKMVTAAAGLERGTMHLGDTHVCNGGLRLGRWFGCWRTHGSENLIGAMADSCDVFFYQEALKLGNPESSGPTYLAQTARKFGLGRAPGIDLPANEARSSRGLVPDPSWRARINQNNPDMARWFPGNTLNFSIGQGDMLATPLQMALVTSAVANGGTLWRPHLLREVRDSDGERVLVRTKPAGQSVGIKPQYIEMVRRGLRAVVTQGTGKRAAIPGIEVSGKTGSAEDDHHALPHAWFVCFAPYKNPTIAIAVIVENSGHGSENALPIARAILREAFPQVGKMSQ